MEEKTRKITFWKVIKWIFIAISILVYLLTFTRIFVSCDADISDDIILTSEEKKDFENLNIDYPLFNYQPTSWTNEDGSIQIKNIYYVEPISELQLTVRYRISYYDKKTDDTPFYYQIRVVEGEDNETVYNNLEYHVDSRYDYKYIRICADDIVINDGERVTNRVQRIDEEGNITYETVSEIIGGNKVYLDIYDSENDELLYSFVVAGRSLSGARVRRNECDTRVID